MEPLAILKQYTQASWPAEYPDIRFIWNRELDPYVDNPALLSRVRWIICADNPGKEEAKSGRFLDPTSASGEDARKVVAQAGFDWEKEVIVLNKSIIHTPTTIELKALPSAAVRATEEFMLQVSIELLSRTRANLWVVGLGGCDSTAPGWPQKQPGREHYPPKCITPYFFAALRDNGAPFKERIFISKHFSHGHFKREMRKLQDKPNLEKQLAALPHAHQLFACEHPT